MSRSTKETSIEVKVDLDGSGASEINTGLGFLDHMFAQLSKHGRIDIHMSCQGDTHIDDHHTAEDCSIALGEAFDKALGKREGALLLITYEFAYVPDILTYKHLFKHSHMHTYFLTCHACLNINVRPYVYRSCVHVYPPQASSGSDRRTALWTRPWLGLSWTSPAGLTLW